MKGEVAECQIKRCKYDKKWNSIHWHKCRLNISTLIGKLIIELQLKFKLFYICSLFSNNCTYSAIVKIRYGF